MLNDPHHWALFIITREWDENYKSSVGIKPAKWTLGGGSLGDFRETPISWPEGTVDRLAGGGSLF